MHKVQWAGRIVAGTAAILWMGAGAAQAEVASDRAAAIVTLPMVQVDGDGRTADDTLIQLSNTSDDPLDLHCFWEDANSHCSNTGEICAEADDCCVGGICGTCTAGWNEVDFRVRLTPRQPIAFLAGDGLSEFPLDGVDFTGVGGSSNAGSRIPPVPEDPFIGALTCIVTDDRGTPINANALIANATLDFAGDDQASYNGVGMRSIEVNNDRNLIIGGEGGEYEGCPNVLVLNHFFDGVEDPVTGDIIETRLILTPCTKDFLRQIPGSAVVQYLVYNEFEQRFSTSRTVRCQQSLLISEIDTTQPDRSIFSAGVAGTVVGQTRMTPIGDGVVAVALEDHDGQVAAFNVHFQGERTEADQISLP